MIGREELNGHVAMSPRQPNQNLFDRSLFDKSDRAFLTWQSITITGVPKIFIAHFCPNSFVFSFDSINIDKSSKI